MSSIYYPLFQIQFHAITIKIHPAKVHETKTPVIAIVGPTASGKTTRAVDVALALGGEIISGDSRQVYRNMTIGTGKDLEEYGSIPYHLIDICEAGEKYNLYGYLRDAEQAYSDICSRGRLPILCGGTGMYVEAFLKGTTLPEVPQNPQLRSQLEHKSLDELTQILQSIKQLHNITDVDTPKRAVRAIEIQTFYLEHPEEATLVTPTTPREALVIGIDIPREARRKKITERLHTRLQAGMIQEVRNLLNSGIKAEDLIYYGLEYKYVTQHVIGDISAGQMFSQLEIAIHQFAKRQMTWFRGMERRGIPIMWLPYDMPRQEFVETIADAYNQKFHHQ